MKLEIKPSNEVDQKIVDRCNEKVKERCMIELAIVRALIKELQSKEFQILTAHNGEDKVTTGNEDILIENLFACDEANIFAGNMCVWLVMGNDGWDVISDYHVALDYILSPFLDKVNYWQEEHEATKGL